jgi:hypothetical protein
VLEGYTSGFDTFLKLFYVMCLIKERRNLGHETEAQTLNLLLIVTSDYTLSTVNFRSFPFVLAFLPIHPPFKSFPPPFPPMDSVFGKTALPLMFSRRSSLRCELNVHSIC